MDMILQGLNILFTSCSTFSSHKLYHITLWGILLLLLLLLLSFIYILALVIVNSTSNATVEGIDIETVGNKYNYTTNNRLNISATRATSLEEGAFSK